MQSPSDKKPSEYAQMLAGTAVPEHPSPGMVPTQEPAAPAAPTVQAPADYMELLGVPKNDYMGVMSPAAPTDMTSTLGLFQPPASFSSKHPIINALVAEPIKDFAYFIYHGLRSGAMGRMPSPVMQQEIAQQIESYIQAQPPEEIKSAQRGFALAASFLPSGLAVDAAAPLIARIGLRFGPRAAIAAKVATFLSGEFLGGATYGAIEPLEPGQSRLAQMAREGATFAVAGGAFAGGGKLIAAGYRKFILKYLGITATDRALARLNIVKQELRQAGTSFDALPPNVRSQILADVYRQTIEESGADVSHVQGFMSNEAKNAGDAIQTSPEVKSILPDPDQPFAFAEPLEAPKDFQPGLAPTATTIDHEIGQVFGLQPNAAEALKRTPSPRRPKGFEPTADEYITAVGVRGRSGKFYPGTTHPQAMADAINSGVPASEFEGARGYKLEENMGAQTNLREFVSRAEGGRIADKAAQRDASRAGADLHSTDLERSASPLNPSGGATKGLPPEALADIAIQDVVARTPLLEVSDNEVKNAAATAKEPPIVPPSRVDPIETVRAEQGPESLVESPLDELDTAARMHDKELEDLQREFMRIANAEPAPVTGLDLLKNDMQKIGSAEADFARQYAEKVAKKLPPEAGIAITRLLTGITGAGLMVHASNEKDPGWKSVWWTIGGMMAAASLYGPVKDYLKGVQAPGKFALDEWTRKITKNLLLNAAPTFLMRNAGSREGARRYIETLTWSRELAHGYRDALEHTFPKDAQRGAQVSIDELNAVKGIFPAEFHSLTPAQQRAAIATNQFNIRLQQMLRAEGAEEDFIQNYARRILPSETFERWRQQGWRSVGMNQRVRLSTLREFEAFAAAHGLPAPIVRLPDIQALRITEAYRTVGAIRTTKMMKGLGLVVDGPKVITDPMPQGWRIIRGVPSLREQMAPEAVAKALENIASPVASRSDILNSADVIKSYWMRSIMFWFWEHGANALRAGVLLSNNPFAIGSMVKTLFSDNQAAYLEAAKYGLNTRARTDYGLRSAKAFEEMAQRVGKIPLIGSIWRGGGALIEKQDRLLWDRIIPSMQLFAYNTEMKKWAERTAGKFLPGSAEYTAAARSSADFANVVFGRVPTELANPQLMQAMRLAFFSPQWTSSRLALTIGAAGELGEIAAGRMNPLHAQYLPFKLRQVAIATAITWILSKALSGNAPEFNPTTSKYYARTGWRSATGREVGLDVLGWWQDDLKLFNDPIAYLGGRLNPVFKVANETVTGRDYAGRDMTYSQRLENLLHSFGPPTEAAELAARSLTPGAPPVTSGELASRISGVSATFNVAALPRPIDAAIARFAEKLLVQAHLPKNEYLVFELSRLLRSNVLSGQQLIDNRVVTYLSYRRRGYATQHPLGYDAGWLWDKGRSLLANF